MSQASTHSLVSAHLKGSIYVAASIQMNAIYIPGKHPWVEIVSYVYVPMGTYTGYYGQYHLIFLCSLKPIKIVGLMVIAAVVLLITVKVLYPRY